VHANNRVFQDFEILPYPRSLFVYSIIMSSWHYWLTIQILVTCPKLTKYCIQVYENHSSLWYDTKKLHCQKRFILNIMTWLRTNVYHPQPCNKNKGFMKPNLLFMSTLAILLQMLVNCLPIPLIEVRANIIFCFPSTFVFSTRRMCWKYSFTTRDCKQNHLKCDSLSLKRKKKKSKMTNVEYDIWK